MSQPMHYVLTLEYCNSSGGKNMVTDFGVTMNPPTTRQQCLVELLQAMIHRYGIPDGRHSIVFFSLEPNTLT